MRLTSISCLLIVAAVVTMGLLCAAPALAVDVGPSVLMRERLLIVQGYVEHYAADHAGVYPAADLVCIGGGLEASYWPQNPWTGEPMSAGATLGCYTYTVAGDGSGYRLTGHTIRKRGIVLAGGGATSYDAECDVYAAQAAELLRQYILDHAHDNNYTCPAEWEVTRFGGVGTSVEVGAWPKNAWTRADMADSSAVGDYAYTPDSDGHHFTLAVRTSTGTVVLSGDTWASPCKARRDALSDGVTKLSTALIRDAVEQWAFDNGGMYPDEYEVSRTGGVGNLFIDLDWPTNPMTGYDMVDEGGTGDYDYQLIYDSGDYTFTIDALLKSGSFSLGPSYEGDREATFRLHYQDIAAQRSIQVIKAYVDHWAATNGGELPSVAQVTCFGAVGAAHTWWPRNPWTWGSMEPGTGYGDYTYTPGTGGSYTLVLHEWPDPSQPAYYPADYPAE
jgi:hypothetical protein